MIYVIIFIILLVAVPSVFLLMLEIKKRRAAGKSGQRRTADLALVQLNQKLRLNPNDASLLTKRGILMQKKDHLKAAMADFQRAIQLDPSLAEPHYHLGMVYYQQRDYASAGREFEWIQTNSSDTLLRTAVSEKLNQLRAKKYV